MDENEKLGVTLEHREFFDSGGRTIDDPDVGRPRKNSKPTGLRVGELPPEYLGIPTDPETGKVLVPDLIRDNDLKPYLVDKTLQEQIDTIAAIDVEGIGDPDKVDESTLQREVKVPLKSHSGSGKSRKPKPKVINTYDAYLADDGTVRGLSDEARARREHERYVRDLEAGRRGNGGPGRPLAEGQIEPKMHLNVRLEPTKVIELATWTGGKKASQLIEELHSLLALARTGAEVQAILAKIQEMLECDE